MISLRLECPCCARDMTVPINYPAVEYTCFSCHSGTRLWAFPALLQEQRGSLGESLHVDDESSCFFHPDRRAVTPCDGCGRFLCALCDIEFNGRHLCSSCIESGMKQDTLPQLRREYVRYDAAALALAIYPVLVFYLTFFTAPIVLYLVLRYWRTPISVLPRNRWRFIAAGFLAGMQTLGWGLLAASIFL